MATYIKGLTGNAPQIQQFKPDHNFYQSVLTLKQNQYDQGLQQVSSLYGSALDVELTRSDNKQKKQEFFNQIEGGIKKLAGLDLSLKQNVEQAYGLFNQFLHDESIQHDAWFTKTSNDELARAEAFRKNCVDPEECGGEWWEGGEQLIQLSLREYKDASLQDALTMQPEEFVPAQNVWKIATDVMKEIDPDKTVEYVTASKEFVVKDKNGDIVNDEVSALLTGILGSDPRIKEYYKAQAKLDRMKYVSMNKDKLGSSDIANAAYYGKKLQELNRSFNALILGTEISDENKGYVESLAVMQKELEQSLSENNFLINLAKAVSGDNTISIDQQVNDVFGKQENETPIQKDIRELFTKQQAILTSLNTINYLFEEAKRNGQYTQGYGTDIMDSYIGNMMLNLEINASMVEPLSNIWSIKQTKTAPGSRTRGRIGSGSGSSGYISRTEKYIDPTTGRLVSETERVNNSNSTNKTPKTQGSGSGSGDVDEKYGGQIKKYQKAGEVIVDGNPVKIKFNILPDSLKFSIENEYKQYDIDNNIRNFVNEPRRSWNISNPTLEYPLESWEKSESENKFISQGYGVENGEFVKLSDKEDGDKVRIEKYKDNLFKENNGCTKSQFNLAYKYNIIADPIAAAQVSQKVYNALSNKGYDQAKLFYSTVSNEKACGSGMAGIDYKDGYGYAGVNAIFMNEKNVLLRKINAFEENFNNFDKAITNSISDVLREKYGADYITTGHQKEYESLVDEFHTALKYNRIKDIIDYNKKELESKNNDLPLLYSLADELDNSVNYKFLDDVVSLTMQSNQLTDLSKFYGDVFDIAFEIEKSKEFWDAQQNTAQEYISQYLPSNIYKATNIANNTISEETGIGGGIGIGTGAAIFGAWGGMKAGAAFGKGLKGKIVGGLLGGIAGAIGGYLVGEEMIPMMGNNMSNTDISKVSLLNNFINYGNACGTNSIELLFSNTPEYRKMADVDIETISNLINDERIYNDESSNPETSQEVNLTPVGIAMMLNSVYLSSEGDVNIYSRDILRGYRSACEKLGCESIDVYDNKVSLAYDNPNPELGHTQKFILELEKDDYGHFSAGKYYSIDVTDYNKREVKMSGLKESQILENPEQDLSAILNNLDITYNEGDYVLPQEKEKELNDLLNSKISVKLNLGALKGVEEDMKSMYGINGEDKENRKKRNDFETNTRWLGVIGKNNEPISIEDTDEDVSTDLKGISELWNTMFNFNFQEVNSGYLTTSQYETFGRTFVFEYPRGYYDNNSNLKFINIDQDMRSKFFDEFLSAIDDGVVDNIFGFELHDDNIYWPETNEEGDLKGNSGKTKKLDDIKSVLKQLRFGNYKNSDNKLLSDRYDVYISPIVNNNQSYMGFTIKDHNGHNLEEVVKNGKISDKITGYTFYFPYDYVKGTNLGKIYRDNSLIYMVKFNDGEITFPASKYNTKCVFKRKDDGSWELSNNPYMQMPRIDLFGYATGMDAVYSMHIGNINNDFYPDNLTLPTNRENIRTKFESDEDLASYLFYLKQCVELNNNIYYNMASNIQSRKIK